MKSASTNWKLPVFIGALVVLALLINYFIYTKAEAKRETKMQEQQVAVAAAQAKKEEAGAKTKAETTRQKAIDEVAAEHARYLARYLNSGFTRKAGVETIGVAIESEQGTVSQNIAVALAQRFKTPEVQILNSFFKPEFVADGLVTKVFSGDTGVFERLELTNYLDQVLVGHQTAIYSTNATLENTVTADLQLELMFLPVGTPQESKSWSFAANGVGFRPHEARQLAEDRIIEQIAKNTNMVLAPRL